MKNPAFKRTLIAAAVIAGASPASVLAETAAATEAVSASAPETEATLPVVTVTAPAAYQSPTLQSPKYSQPLVETPQTVTVLTEALLDDQGVTTLRDALRNVTGISLQAGEGNPPSGDQLKIRGFSSRDDILLDGARDVGIYFRDPFNVEQIEVAKGPSSAIAGRGSTGGTINMVSKSPRLEAFTTAEVSVGTDELYRTAIDFNQPIRGTGTALRLNVLGHSDQKPGREEAENQRWAVAPSLAFGLGGPTRLTLQALYTEQNNVTDSGLPNARNLALGGSGLEGRVAPVDFGNYYGHTTDYQDLTAHQLTARLEHDFSASTQLRSQIRQGRVDNDAIFSSPRLFVNANCTNPGGQPATLDSNTFVCGNQKPRDQVTEIVVIQNDLTTRFTTGSVRHTLVTGLELGRQQDENRRRLDANGPSTNLFNPSPRPAAPIAYNGTKAGLEQDATSVYLSDNIGLTEKFEINAGVRWDHIQARVKAENDGGVPAYTQNLETTDTEWSGNLGFVYKLLPHASVYFGTGTSFDPSGRADVVQLAGGNNNLPTSAASFTAKPERSQSYELGTKWNVLNETLLLQAALFRTDKTDARLPGANPGDPAIILDGQQRVQGLELSASGRVTNTLNLFAGYTYQDGEVRKSNRPFEVGQRLDNTPLNSFSGWLTWQALPKLSLGGGVQYVGERTSNVRQSAASDFVITAEDYVLVDAVAAYQIHPHVGIRINGYNLADEKYLFELNSGQSVPGSTRAGVMSVVLNF